ncbi:hypothetical protein GCM10027036_34300 [Flavihumibacter cheonanensis]|uniref:hypothetical protein n=1 Tax=Flavihumibacter cheonanensis TaxID=1442385 RepID=UPI001EF83554|nr:hypothetical protein [Flavihumibacter cheonanensis]MCG7754811.1 hypothetical protein [Flavihumibacter cheonanensis]
MKKAIGIILFLFLNKYSFGQTHSIVGAWFWSDSTKQTSIFFKQDGSIQMHSGSKGGEILTKNLRNGTYILTSKMLKIKWVDNTEEKIKINFVDKHSFVLTVGDKNKKTEQTFRRVVDEEVIEE